jgi:hypothetical protein
MKQVIERPQALVKATREELIARLKTAAQSSPPTPATDRYVGELHESVLALSRYQKHGNGSFIWQAYKHARAARIAFPGYQKEQIEHLNSVRPEWKTTKGNLTDLVLTELTEQILEQIDAIADDLLLVRGTWTTDDAASLRKALRMQDDLNPVRADGRAKEEDIILEFIYQTAQISVTQERITKEKRTGKPGDPGVSRTGLYGNIGKKFDVTRQHVGATIKRYLAERADDKARIDAIFVHARALKPKKPSAVKTVRSKKKRGSNAAHPWGPNRTR